MSQQALRDNTKSFDPSTVNTFQLTNSNYNTLPVKIRVDGSDPGTIDLAPGGSLSFAIAYSSGKATFSYQGSELQMIDLNDGGRSDDFLSPNGKDNDENTLRYDAGSPQGELDVINFDSNTYVVDFTDRDGVDGGTRALFHQTVSGNTLKCSISVGKRP